MKFKLTAILGSCLSVYAMTGYAINDIATASDCIDAKPHCMLQVTPPPANSNQKFFNVKQLCDGRFEFIFEYSLDDQLAERKFLGRKFCNGIVSYSDMDLPFFKTDGVTDANDGLLAMDVLTSSAQKISEQINKMQEIASKVSTGSYSSTQLSNLDMQFSNYLSEVNRIASVTMIGHMPILDGSSDSLAVPIHHGKQSVSISLYNLTTGSGGLNIASLDVLSKRDAKDAVKALKVTAKTMSNALKGFTANQPQLETAAKEDAVITSIDISGPQFIVKTEKAQP